MTKRQSISTGLGVLAGAILGGILEGLNWAIFLADHHRAGADPFESGDFGYLVLKAIVSISAGIIGAVGGVFLSTNDGPETPGGRKLLSRIAGGIAIAAVAGCLVCVALAASGIAVVPITGSLAAGVLSSNLEIVLLTLSGMVAGLVVGAVRADN
ncbi:hypothetical protein [Actinomadura mexicana]|uniref:Uncharacterized protein n=1 Tax=Actinomadura mexicana TaxID=134959 RepID=A0A238UTK0_9ACTN|nr:hypothetical protein [Actinomadura mexicana]SNR25204.1 hypothetical protein SAMN06265355_101379 [Actinomadura mexicana]